MGVSLGQLLVILLIVLVLFGAGKLPKVMMDLGKAVRLFRDSMNKEDEKSKQLNKDNDDL